MARESREDAGSNQPVELRHRHAYKYRNFKVTLRKDPNQEQLETVASGGSFQQVLGMIQSRIGFVWICIDIRNNPGQEDPGNREISAGLLRYH